MRISSLLRFFVILSSFIALMACKSAPSVTSVSPAEFRSDIQSLSDPQLLDVRTPEEFAESHLPGAVNIDVQSPLFLEHVSEKFSPSRPILVYCRSGKRSMMAANKLAADGYTVIDLAGGILAWQSESLPTVTD